MLMRDLHVWTESAPLRGPAAKAPQFGTLFLEYEVRAYDDVRNLKVERAYLVSCKQRIVIPSQCDAEVTSFSGYPALLTNAMTLVPRTGSNDQFSLVDYQPRTLNSSIAMTQNNLVGTDSQASTQYTTGSSMSETNSYDVSVNLGVAGEGLAGGIGAARAHSDTYTVDQSRSTGHAISHQLQSASSDGMTIKDWGSYAKVDVDNQAPSWTWAQEYPWDLIQFQTSVGDYVMLPQYVKDRLGVASPQGQAAAFPPSRLSLFGLNFVSKASWLYTMADPVAAQDVISFTHEIGYSTATHGVFGSSIEGEITVVAKGCTYPPANSGLSQLDLGQLALNPLAADPDAAGAIVGFVKSQFIAPPSATATAPFSIKSAANNLYVTGTGFDAPGTEDDPLSAAAVTAQAPLTLRVSFKVADADEIYALFVKHWKTTATGCVMTITINGVETVVRHVDAFEAGSGADNTTKVVLRNRDYSTGEFYDYLVLGLNTIDLSIASADASHPAGYAIRALAIA